MAGRRPKPPEQRQRRNRAATAAELPGEAEAKRRRAPSLPSKDDGEWHELTRAWWRAVWRSPMAKKFLEADRHGLYRLAALIDAFWSTPTTALAAEIRLEEARFGLSPMDRHRLQWQIVPDQKPKRNPAKEGPTDDADPRAALRLVQ